MEKYRYRVIISTDIGGDDPDDFQSLVHYLVYADMFDTEGLISSPPYAGRKHDILDVINAYEQDYPNLTTYSKNYPSPDMLRELTKQGAIDVSPSKGYSTSSEGSEWIIKKALSGDHRPLYILAWGSMTDIAQAVHDNPLIKSKIRIYSIGSWNTKQDPYARDYLYTEHSDLWWIENNSTFRGMYIGGTQNGDLSNLTFIEQHVKGHGTLGDFLYDKKKELKMGDTPSVLYLLNGDPDNPATESWGGRFELDSQGINHWVDASDPELIEYTSQGVLYGAKTVNKWRVDYLRDWQYRMDRCLIPNPMLEL